MHDEISWDFIKTLVVTRENKIKALRKAKGFTPSRLAKQAKVDKNHLLALEKSKTLLMTEELSKIAVVLGVDCELLLDASAVLSLSELRLLDFIFMKYKQNPDISLLQTQILNWAVVLLHNNRREWEKTRRESINLLCLQDRKAAALKRAQSRDKKYAPFREYFKKVQQKHFLKYQKAGKMMSANSFVYWFLQHKEKEIEIPYQKSNLQNQLYQLARLNNREFKKTFECKS